MLWTVLIVILLVGGAYFLLLQRRKPSHLQAPEGEVFATDGAPETAAPVT